MHDNMGDITLYVPHCKFSGLFIVFASHFLSVRMSLTLWTNTAAAADTCAPNKLSSEYIRMLLLVLITSSHRHRSAPKPINDRILHWLRTVIISCKHPVKPCERSYGEPTDDGSDVTSTSSYVFVPTRFWNGNDGHAIHSSLFFRHLIVVLESTDAL